jgi:hypothetical protein
LAKAHKERRRQVLRQHLALVEQELHVLGERHGRMQRSVQTILNTQHELALQWHRGEAIAVSDLRSKMARDEEQLRESLLELSGESSRRTRDLSLVLLGRDVGHARMLWSAYAELVRRNGWTLEASVLMPYAAIYDSNSAEYRKRQQRNVPAQLPPYGLGEPVVRLLGAADAQGAREKLLDVYRVDIGKLEQSLPGNAAGILLRFQGEGVGTWLSDEDGVHHIIQANKTGAQKRLRVRVCAVPGSIVAWEVPSNWDQVPSLPERDPRRVYHMESQTITEMNSNQNWRWETGMESVALAELITENRERALWQGIGYERTPARSMYSAVPQEEMPI